MIRFAKKNDTDDIMRFIDLFWRKGHILSRDKRLFEWQYGTDSDKLNIVVGIDEIGNIQGMLGFIPYDNNDKKDIALALWKANPGTGFLGIKLIKYLLENEPHREVVCPGINMDTTSKIYQHIGMKIGTMSHWYRLAKRDEYLIAKVVDRNISELYHHKAGVNLLPIKGEDELDSLNFRLSESRIPFKSISYIKKRYFRHPLYKYDLYQVKASDSKTDTMIILRTQEYKGSKVLRLIDCIGDVADLRYVTELLDELMDKMDCEYIDTYEIGVNDEYLASAGWNKVEDEGNVIPDYFSPFEQRKVDIHYSTSADAAILFKGDGDQDRPN